MWICPTCKSKDHLEVVIETWAKLIQPDDEPEAFQTDLDEASQHDHEWSENSVMMCVNPACAESSTTHIAEYFEVDHPVRPADTDACADQGIQVTEQALSELGPVGASIEAAEEEPAAAAMAEIWGTLCPDCGPTDYAAIVAEVKHLLSVRPADTPE